MRLFSFAPAVLAASLAGGLIPSCGQGNVFELSVGDCFDEAADFDGGEVSDVPIVDCEEPHDYEVFATEDWNEGDDYPGDAALVEWADGVCEGAFESYVGSPYATSALYYTHLVPSAGSWTTGDREVACMLVEVDGNGEVTKMEGSMRDSNR